MNTFLIGIDEAGRGPVIGPLVVAAVWLTETQQEFLATQGVTDSKKISSKKREELYTIIKQNATYCQSIHISAKQIDQALDKKISLTTLELQHFLQVLKTHTHKQVKVYIDCPSINTKSVYNFFKEQIPESEFFVEHKADQNHICVGAASIIAKVERDREIESIQHTIPVPIGSGYPSDPATQTFIREYHDKYDVFRKSWKTYKVLTQPKQKTLLDI